MIAFKSMIFLIVFTTGYCRSQMILLCQNPRGESAIIDAQKLPLAGRLLSSCYLPALLQTRESHQCVFIPVHNPLIMYIKLFVDSCELNC